MLATSIEESIKHQSGVYVCLSIPFFPNLNAAVRVCAPSDSSVGSECSMGDYGRNPFAKPN